MPEDQASNLQEKTTFYDKISSSWKNNKVVAALVFFVVVLIAVLKVYSELSNFVARVDPPKDRIAEFNRLVQPIYFQERFAKLAPGQEAKIRQMIKDIKEIDPSKIIIKSHTSRVSPAPNAAIARTRGEWVRDMLKHDGGFSYSKMVVVPYGGVQDKGLEKGYEQRVEIELSN